MMNCLTSWILLALLQYVSGQCTVGHNEIIQANARRSSSFYLNTGRPAQCKGYITAFSYCYYSPSTDAAEYLTTFALYRPGSEESFSVVSQVFEARRTLTELTNDLEEDNFACTNFTLDQPVPVEVGDVLGACVFNPRNDSVSRLELAGLDRDNRGDMRRISNPSTSLCNETTVPSSVDPSTSGIRQSIRTLYLSASITNDTSIFPTTETPVSNSGGNSDGNSGGGGGGGTAAAVIIVLLLVGGSVAAIVVVVVLWKRKQKRSQDSYIVSPDANKGAAIDNMVYLVEDKQAEGSEENPFEEHIYELEEEHTSKIIDYAEVGPYEETVEIEYESPLDAPSISFARLLEKNMEEDIYGFENPYEVPAESEDDIYAQFKTWGVANITTCSIQVVSHLGSGQFGSVEQGVWKRQGTKPVDVALKSLTKTSEEDKVKFLQEAAIMAQFRHPNVIMLYGVVAKEEPMRLVVEFASRGDMRNFLISQRPDPGELLPGTIPAMLLQFSQQVALGMQYLSAKGFIHRDLAARNVLITEAYMCKVADFGMSRDLDEANYYIAQERGMIPVKWTAPEAIHYKKYSTASDVWSYGCLLYEIWSLGHKPFEGVNNLTAIRHIDCGKRLPPPPGCSKLLYELMMNCWYPETSGRPAFRDIVLTLVGSEEMVLNIPEEDSSTNPLAGVLGAPLEAGENMYSELQKRYIDYHHGADAQSDEDYF